MGTVSRWHLGALVAAAAVGFSPAVGAQHLVDPRMTGIFGRAAFSLGVMNLDELSFTAQRPHRGREGSFSGKQLGWGRHALPGFSLGLHVDARWFYVRVGAVLYDNASIDGDSFDARFTTLAAISAGPRFVVGPIGLYGGARVGALFANVTERASGTEYSAFQGVVAVEAGAQWRPWRWVQLDVAVGQDVLALRATTVSIAVNVGWSREP